MPSRLAAAVPMENPYSSCRHRLCKLTRAPQLSGRLRERGWSGWSSSARPSSLGSVGCCRPPAVASKAMAAAHMAACLMQRHSARQDPEARRVDHPALGGGRWNRCSDFGFAVHAHAHVGCLMRRRPCLCAVTVAASLCTVSALLPHSWNVILVLLFIRIESMMWVRLRCDNEKEDRMMGFSKVVGHTVHRQTHTAGRRISYWPRRRSRRSTCSGGLPPDLPQICPLSTLRHS